MKAIRAIFGSLIAVIPIDINRDISCCGNRPNQEWMILVVHEKRNSRVRAFSRRGNFAGLLLG